MDIRTKLQMERAARVIGFSRGDPGTLAVWRSTRKLRPIKASAGANGGQAPLDGGSEPILLPPGQPTQ